MGSNNGDPLRAQPRRPTSEGRSVPTAGGDSSAREVRGVVPYTAIDTLFLDAGNTLISIDFEWVTAELRALGFECTEAALRRAEAGARPELSPRISKHRSVDGTGPFRVYLRAILSRVPLTPPPGPERIETLTGKLVPILHTPRQANRLWRSVMPRVREALDVFYALGLRLVVVSNSDGTIDQSLRDTGLRPYFSAVLDSALVGYEKPDPRIFERALVESGADRERTLHVGDMYHVDVEGARRAGLYAILLDPFDDWPSYDCERVADLHELAGRFEQHRNGAN